MIDAKSIVAAMKLIHQHLGLVVEPAGAVGLAAILENKERFYKQTLATPLCGSNVHEEQLQSWLF